MIEIAGVIGEVGFEDVEPAIAVVVADRDSHARLFVPVFAVGAAGNHRDIGEGAVVIVAEQNTRLGINRNVDVGPAVVVEIV